MKAIPLFCIGILASTALPVMGQDGTLNPEELSIARVLSDVEHGAPLTMMHCAAGYGMTKKGDHAEARQVFEACADLGYTGAMTWMGQLSDNGLGAPEDPVAAAAWDRRASDAGDPLGMYNYGLDLMRGRGVPMDVDRGRALVDRAAAAGIISAERLQAADYDLDVVTPDADNWKYDRKLF